MENERRNMIEYIGEELQMYRNKFKKTQAEMAELADISVQTYARYEKGACDDPGFFNLVALLKELPTYNRNVILKKLGLLGDELCIEDNGQGTVNENIRSETEVPMYNAKPDHLKRLNTHYANMRYTMYYYESKHKRENIVTMKLRFSEVKESGFLEGVALVKNKVKYSLKLISPPKEYYTYIYLTSESSFDEQAVVVIPLDRHMEGKFHGGVGVMLSLSLDADGPRPCFQKVILASEQSNQLSTQQQREIFEKILVFSLEDKDGKNHMLKKIYADDIFGESSEFYTTYLKSTQFYDLD